MGKAISTINSIETSSICDNECPYCPAKDQGDYRETGFMSMEVFEKALSWVSVFVAAGTQRELNLFGVGEPTLNPNIIEMVRMARRVLPMRLPVHLNTNGNRMTEELAIKLRDAGIHSIDITGHDARATANTIRIFRKVGISGRLSVDFITNPNNWAGQVDWFPPEYDAGICPWLDRGQVMVMSNGDITTCCIDAFGTNILGNVIESDVVRLRVSEMPLCSRCHHEVPKEESLIVTSATNIIQ